MREPVIWEALQNFSMLCSTEILGTQRQQKTEVAGKITSKYDIYWLLQHNFAVCTQWDYPCSGKRQSLQILLAWSPCSVYCFLTSSVWHIRYTTVTMFHWGYTCKFVKFSFKQPLVYDIFIVFDYVYTYTYINIYRNISQYIESLFLLVLFSFI